MKTLATVEKTFRFDAAHQLPNHKGKCARLHGHTYRIVIGVTGVIQEAPGESHDGMVMDFDDLTSMYNKFIHQRLDHQFLNEIIPAMTTTAENLAVWIFRNLSPKIFESESRYLDYIEVWETPTSRAIVKDVDNWARFFRGMR